MLCEQCLSVGKGCSMVPKVRVDTVVGMIDLDGLHVHTTAFESELNSEAARKASRDSQKAVHDGTTSTLHSTTRSKQAQVPPKPALCSQQCLFAAAPCRHVGSARKQRRVCFSATHACMHAHAPGTQHTPQHTRVSDHHMHARLPAPACVHVIPGRSSRPTTSASSRHPTS